MSTFILVDSLRVSYSYVNHTLFSLFHRMLNSGNIEATNAVFKNKRKNTHEFLSAIINIPSSLVMDIILVTVSIKCGISKIRSP